jgi:hypothetical protein
MMSTTALSSSGRIDRRAVRTNTAGIHVGRIGIGTVGVLTVLVAAWGGIVPFVGPAFGFSGDGAGSWHWSLTHAVLALVPGAIGLVVGGLVLAQTKGIAVGRGRLSLTLAGLIAMVCGAWFIVGPLAWPVITTHGAYFVAASPLRNLAHQVGYALGTGLILAVCGGFITGWASRHQLKASLPADGSTPASGPADVADPAAPASA